MNQETVSLRVEGVSKRFGETQALDDVSVVFSPGSVHTVFGENGSGKSTLVKNICGIIVPDKGAIYVGAQPVRRYHPAAMKQLGVIPVMQEILVAPNRSVLENVFMGYDPMLRWRLSHAQRVERAAAMLARVTDTRIDLNAPVGRLPLPQQQLVVIARALLNEPRVLLLDEATAALSIEDRYKIFTMIRDLTAAGKCVILISHRMDEVLELSDEVTVLRSGKKVATLARADVTTTRLLHLVQPEAKELERVVDV